jgi:hypothetical protein
MPYKHMGDGNITSDIYAYELPGVPWTSFFVLNGLLSTALLAYQLRHDHEPWLHQHEA